MDRAQPIGEPTGESPCLSLGEQQRLGMARAILQAPLPLDEATASLCFRQLPGSSNEEAHGPSTPRVCLAGRPKKRKYPRQLGSFIWGIPVEFLERAH
jgi:hypothetical protein